MGIIAITGRAGGDPEVDVPDAVAGRANERTSHTFVPAVRSEPATIAAQITAT